MIEKEAEFDRWPPDHLIAEPLHLSACVTEDPTVQPGFSLVLGWNKPGTDWRPFVVVQVWRKHYQIGWLF